MDQREKAIIHYAVIMTIHDDARRMASTLRNQFTPEEREEIKELTQTYAKYTVTPEQQIYFEAMQGVTP